MVPTLEAMQKMIKFCHHKNIYMLELGCSLPNLANICVNKSTNVEFYLFTDSDKNLLKKRREDMIGDPSIVITRKAEVVPIERGVDARTLCRSDGPRQRSADSRIILLLADPPSKPGVHA